MTLICNFIQLYETIVWNYLSDVFRYSLKSSELGITNDLVYRIVSFYGRFQPQYCEVYIFNERIHENRRGADIDLFIEDNGSGNFHFFMLQAKIMNYKGRYKDIRNWSPHAQFNTLINSASTEGAYPLYLLYNGKTGNSNIGNTNWGLSIVEASQIRNLRLSQSTSTRIPRVTFNQLHSRGMNPFNVLFCNLPSKYKLSSIPGKNIYKGYPYVQINRTPDQNLSEKGEEESNEDKHIDVEGLKIIKDKNLALFRIIIKTEKI
jgi:hypothetical protein